MKAKAIMKREMVAPSGMNCNLCSWVLDPAKPGRSPCTATSAPIVGSGTTVKTGAEEFENAWKRLLAQAEITLLS
jgi:hypothetical protein